MLGLLLSSLIEEREALASLVTMRSKGGDGGRSFGGLKLLLMGGKSHDGFKDSSNNEGVIMVEKGITTPTSITGPYMSIPNPMCIGSSMSMSYWHQGNSELHKCHF